MFFRRRKKNSMNNDGILFNPQLIDVLLIITIFIISKITVFTNSFFLDLDWSTSKISGFINY
jgi:hypothetical protein